MAYVDWRSDIIGILDERKHPYWWVESQISAGRIALLENDKAIIGVERVEYPGGLVELHGMFAAGEREAIFELIDDACEAGKAAGCDVATISSRPAWAKLLKERGFETSQVTIAKELS